MRLAMSLENAALMLKLMSGEARVRVENGHLREIVDSTHGQIAHPGLFQFAFIKCITLAYVGRYRDSVGAVSPFSRSS